MSFFHVIFSEAVYGVFRFPIFLVAFSIKTTLMHVFLRYYLLSWLVVELWKIASTLSHFLFSFPYESCLAAGNGGDSV